MLREMLDRTGIEPRKAAGLLGIDTELFEEWLSNQKSIPQSILDTLSSVVGLDLSPYMQRKVASQEAASLTPAIWFRFRGERLVSEDREFVFLIRRLGNYINDLEEVTGARAVGWKALFQEIRQRVNIQAPPRIQGIEAANMFRESRGLSSGADGIGEILRGNLRAMGMLVVESPIPESQLEGCCFYLGNRSTESERPCVFANSHHTTWFRRNMILLHEVAHAIFDAESAGATLDFVDEGEPHESLAEQRADAFAQQVLAPRQTLVHVTQRSGIKWNELSPRALARVIADVHAEKRTILRSAFEAGLISMELYAKYGEYDVSALLPSLTQRALSTSEYIKSLTADEVRWVGKRTTTTTSRPLRLPMPYVKSVVDVWVAGDISAGKAAEMLMIDDDTFAERFAEQNHSDQQFA